ncbi:MAG: hypothetical protein ACOC0N_10835 [Chroococcales cyanobacterium]
MNQLGVNARLKVEKLSILIAMTVGTSKHIFAIFSALTDAEGALQELKEANFPMKQVAFIKQDSFSERNPMRKIIGNKSQAGTDIGGIMGGTAGGTVGFIAGMATASLIPPAGLAIAIGEAALAFAMTLTSGILGASAGTVFGGFIGLHIPDDRTSIYEKRLDLGEYILMLKGTYSEILKAEEILNRWQVQELRVYESESLGVDTE